MNKKYQFLLPLLFALCTALGMILGSGFGPARKSSPFQKSEYKKLDQVFDLLNSSYVDTPNGPDLVEVAIEKVLDELDPYSAYVSANDLAHVNAQLQSSFDGIGVEFNIIRDTITVVTPIHGGPSEKLGILPGDRIVEVNGEPVAGMNIGNDDVRTKLMGPKGTEVKVGIKRQGQKQLLDFTIIRDKIPMQSVDVGYLISDDIGYVKVSRFAEDTGDELEATMSDLLGEGMEHMILDLRGNPGGYLGQAVQMANIFLKKDELIVFTQGRSRSRDDYNATGTGIFQTGKLVVLIDEGSASASEIVAGAIQDQDRGIIMGRRSHGKGTVQEPMTLLDGSSLRLTVARYYTPSGRCIQRDYEDVKSGKTANDSLSKEFTTKGGRIVKDAGGILPDVEVALDTATYSSFLAQLVARGAIFQFVGLEVDANRQSFESEYSTFEDFSSNFTFSGEIESAFRAYLEKNEIAMDEEGFETSKSFISTQIKAQLAKRLFGNEYYYQVINSQNKVVKKALESFSDEQFAALLEAVN